MKTLDQWKCTAGESHINKGDPTEYNFGTCSDPKLKLLVVLQNLLQIKLGPCFDHAPNGHVIRSGI